MGVDELSVVVGHDKHRVKRRGPRAGVHGGVAPRIPCPLVIERPVPHHVDVAELLLPVQGLALDRRRNRFNGDGVHNHHKAGGADELATTVDVFVGDLSRLDAFVEPVVHDPKGDGAFHLSRAHDDLVEVLRVVQTKLRRPRQIQVQGVGLGGLRLRANHGELGVVAALDDDGVDQGGLAVHGHRDVVVGVPIRKRETLAVGVLEVVGQPDGVRVRDDVLQTARRKRHGLRLQFHGVGAERPGLQHHEALQGRVGTVGDGEFDVVRLSALHGCCRSERAGVAVGADALLRRVVDVVRRVGDVVHRADRHRQKWVRFWHLRDVDGPVGEACGSRVRPGDAWSAQEEREDVVVLGVHVGQVLVRAKHVVERDAVPARFKVKFQDAQIVHAVHAEGLADEWRHAVGHVEQVRVHPASETVRAEVVAQRVVGVEHEACIHGEHRGAVFQQPQLGQASSVGDVGGGHAVAEQDFLDVFLRRAVGLRDRGLGHGPNGGCHEHRPCGHLRAGLEELLHPPNLRRSPAPQPDVPRLTSHHGRWTTFDPCPRLAENVPRWGPNGSSP